MIAAEARAVEDGHHARLDRDGRHFLVRSDSWADVDYRVRITSVGETVVFECDHWCYDAETGDKVRGRQPARTYSPCKHGALGARRLERQGLLRWDLDRWVPTALTLFPDEADTDRRRFLAKVRVFDDPTACWRWMASKAHGYGQFIAAGRHYNAHRWAYLAWIGPIEEGLEADHLCHGADLDCAGGASCPHRGCVNPWHVEPVAPKINNERGRGHGSETHCPEGHEYTVENTYVTKQNKRHCRTCHRERQRRYREQARHAREATMTSDPPDPFANLPT